MFFSTTSLTGELLEENNNSAGAEDKQRPEAEDHSFVVNVDVDSVEELEEKAREETGHGLLGPENEVVGGFGMPEDPVERAHLNAYRAEMNRIVEELKSEYRQDKNIHNHSMYHGCDYSEPERVKFDITR